MAGHAKEEIGKTEVRRRHSGQHDGEDLAGDGIEMLSGARRSATDPARPTSSGNDVPLTATHQTTEQLPRVKFSLDSARMPQRSVAKKRKSDESIGQTDAKGGRSLSLDTDRAAEGNAVISPSNMASPTGQARTPVAPVSALPRGRQRGYSLRSALFQRNMRDRSTEDSDNIMEMSHVAGPSNQTGQSRPLSRHANHGQSSKKSMDTVVEISPMDDGELEDHLKLPYTEPRAGVQGIAALPNYHSWIQKRAARNQTWRTVKNACSRTRKFVLRIQEIPPTKDGRHIDLDPSRKKALLDERTGRGYIPNTIRSSRYNAWNFVPRQLFAQFSKLANFYFLCVSILQMIPGLSTTGSKYIIAFSTFKGFTLTVVDSLYDHCSSTVFCHDFHGKRRI